MLCTVYATVGRLSVCPVPRFWLNTYSSRAFSVAGQMAWNSFPDFFRYPKSNTDFFTALWWLYLQHLETDVFTLGTFYITVIVNRSLRSVTCGFLYFRFLQIFHHLNDFRFYCCKFTDLLMCLQINQIMRVNEIFTRQVFGDCKDGFGFQIKKVRASWT